LNQIGMADETGRSATDNIREVAQASETLLKAGKQLKDNLSELGDRVENVTERTSNVFKESMVRAYSSGGNQPLGITDAQVERLVRYEHGTAEQSSRSARTRAAAAPFLPPLLGYI
jgi:hypothetical protein